MFVDWVESKAFFFGGGLNPPKEQEYRDERYEINLETEDLQKDFEEKYKKLYGE